MSVQRAINAAADAAIRNPAARQPTIIFLDRELVHTRQPEGIPVASELWGIARAMTACRALAVRMMKRLTTWHDRARGRRALASLDPRLRRDIGITELEVWREVNKPFWYE